MILTTCDITGWLSKAGPNQWARFDIAMAFPQTGKGD
jgi:hypothetical protein